MSAHTVDCIDCITLQDLRTRAARRHFTFVAPRRTLLERLRAAYLEGWTWYAQGGSFPATEPAFPLPRAGEGSMDSAAPPGRGR